MPWKEIDPVVDETVRSLCARPYQNHKRGCPPQAPMLADFFDLSQPVYVIWNEYDFKAHTDRMRAAHPAWTQRQVERCLYWQGTARKDLKGEIISFLHDHTTLVANACPEAMGANVTETMRQAGIELEWPPVNKTYQVAFAGTRKRAR